MTPEQFLQRIQTSAPTPVYLFLGQEGYGRKLCREALLKKVLPDVGEDAVSRFDLEQVTLAEVLDDARSLSLFARERVIWVTGAEMALPRRLSVDSEGSGSGDDSGNELKAYLAEPTAGTVVVLDCSRYDFAGDDRAKMERVQKFYAPVPVVVEFRHYTPEACRNLGQQLAREQKLKIGNAELAVLIDAVASDANRLAVELEKLALYVGNDRAVTRDDLTTLVPNTAQSTIFAMVNALGKRDRSAALRSLDALIREGEYLPLALTFLSTQFRLALAAKEARITSSQKAQSYFTGMGVRIWRERAEQVLVTATEFTQNQLARAVALIYETDKKFREGYRDDRVVMETLVFGLTERK